MAHQLKKVEEDKSRRGSHDAQRALRADEEMFQIVARIVLAQPPQCRPDLACGRDHLKTQTQLARIAIAQHGRASGVGRQVAAHRAAALSGERKREQPVYLLRGFLHKQGSVYYLNYPRAGFSLDLICAQIDDLVAELNRLGQRPALFGVSFGAGLIIEWLRRSRLAGRSHEIAGTVLVSPVACAADIVAPDEPKPSTLIGRALKPFLDAGGSVNPGVIEKARVIFTKMFEAGAQNQASLRALMTAAELRHLHSHVISAIQSIDFTGACERLSALRELPALSAWDDGPRPLSTAPALVLYAEKETAVLHERSPTRAALATTLSAFFPAGTLQVVGGGTSPVQHASLIFHYFQFLPPITAFYRGLKSGKVRLAA
jgi:alpha-beta hydrolase superfamily lysophospholipase